MTPYVSAPLVLPIRDEAAFAMTHIARHPSRIGHVGNLGAAIVAYVGRELAANAFEHGGARGDGEVVIAAALRVEISLPSTCFDSSKYVGAAGGLRTCRKLLVMNRIRGSSDHQDGANRDTLIFEARLDYVEAV